MKTNFTTIALALASSLIAGTSFAGEGHAQVKPVRAQTVSSVKIVASGPVAAELAEAIRTGDIVANGQTGLKLNELYPNRYPEKQVQVGLTREQVSTELAQAVRTGDIMANGQTGLKLNELYPSRYPAKQMQAGVTREQVKAELAQAVRTGDFFVGGEAGGKCNELHPNMHTAM
jgi:lambda repressor-like predicted transcriptional regulator